MKILMIILMGISLFGLRLKTERVDVDLFILIRLAILILFCVNY